MTTITNPLLLDLNNTKSSIESYASNTDISNSDSVKRTKNYLKWTSLKTNLIQSEDDIILPKSSLPQEINSFIFSKLTPEQKTLILKYYDVHTVNSSQNKYTLNSCAVIANEDMLPLAKSLIILPKKVVWIDYGFNIGDEFGGRHPALIIKVTGSSIFTLPLSSQTPSNIEQHHVEILKVYSFRNQVRWTSILRLRDVSIKRIDFSNTIGEVKKEVVTKALTAIRDYWTI